MLKLPAWTDAQHPIGRHERVVWRKFLSRWWWLAIIPIGFVLMSALCSLTGNLPLFIQLAATPNTPEMGVFAGAMIVQTLFQTVWNLNTTIQWIIGVAIGFGCAVTIARERETKNWELLCLTPMTAGEIALAKTYTIVRQFVWPILITTVINVLMIFLFAAAIVVGVLVVNAAAPNTLPNGVPQIAIALTLLITPLVLLFILVNTILDVLSGSAVGLAASCWSKTRANAVALTIVINFILNIFILIPIYFVMFIGIALAGGMFNLLGISPITSIALVILLIAALFVGFRVATVAAAVFAARYQLNRLTE